MNKKNLTINEAFRLALENHKKNNLMVAENCYKSILKKNSNHLESNFYLASLYVQTGKLILAKKLFEKTIQIQPNFPDAYNNLGAVLKELGKYREAIKFCEKATKIKPNHAAAYNNIGAALKDLGEFDKAKNYFQKALEIQPKLTGAYRNLGMIYKELGDLDKEFNTYQKLSKINPSSALAYQNLGRLHIVFGNIKEAINCYHEAIKFEPENLFHYYHLSNLTNKILNLKLKNKINIIVKNTNSNKKNIAYGNFLLARYELEEKNYEKEFDYLLKGHLNFFESEGEKYKNDVKYWLETLPKAINSTKFKNDKKILKNKQILKPIFIVGLPRSGSTLVEKIIASGAKYIPMGEETGILSNLARQKILKKESLNSHLDEFNSKLFEKYGQRGLVEKKNDYTFTDKTLDNFFYMSLINEIFPDAKIINCKRKNISIIMSILKNNLPGLAWAHNLKNIFRYFDLYYQMLNNFNKNFPDLIYNLEFDELVNNPENESKKLMKFCNLTWDVKCLEFYKRKDLVSRTTSNVQIRNPIYKHDPEKYVSYIKLLKTYGNKYSWYK